MGSLVRLKNRDATPFVGTLFHATYCAKGGSCGCKQEQVMSASLNPQTGETGLKRIARAVPVGFSIPPGQTSPPMHKAVLMVPGVREAIALRRLVAVPVVDEG